MQLKNLKKNVGKRVVLSVPGYFNNTLRTNIKKHKVVGVMSFVGFNKYLHQKQVTISGCPYVVEDWNQIKLK